MNEMYEKSVHLQQVSCTDPGAKISHTHAMTEDSQVPAKLKRLRNEAGLTVRAAASALDMTPSTYGYYEQKSFKKAHLPWDLATKIADVFAKHGVDRDAVLALAAETTPLADSVKPVDQREMADQISDIIRMFVSIQDADLRASRYEMVKVILATEENQPVTARVSDQKASHRS